MNKKFSIVKVIDFDKLDYEINRYIATTGERNPYIFMNEDTVDAMKNDAVEIRTNEIHGSGVTGLYCGYQVFINNYLKFGEVEIR